MKKLIIIFSLIFLIGVLSSLPKKDTKIELSVSTWGSQTEISTIKKHEEMKMPPAIIRRWHIFMMSENTPNCSFENNLGCTMTDAIKGQ